MCPRGGARRRDRSIPARHKQSEGHPPPALRPGNERDLQAATALFGLRPCASHRPYRFLCPRRTRLSLFNGKEESSQLLPGAAIAKRDGNRPLPALPVRPGAAAARRPERAGRGREGAQGTANVAQEGSAAAYAARLLAARPQRGSQPKREPGPSDPRPAQEKLKELFMNRFSSQMQSPGGT